MKILIDKTKEPKFSIEVDVETDAMIVSSEAIHE